MPNIQPPSREEATADAMFQQLLQTYLASRHRRKTDIIEKAYRFAKRAHAGSRRQNGDPYILHPVAVAQIIAGELGLGSTSICAALLHETLTKTDYTYDDLTSRFGPKIAAIVQGIAKISGGIFGGDRAGNSPASNFRNLLLSMSTDVRVILVKMADRLNNMRTISALRPSKQLRVAEETLNVYAPIAERLGLNKIKSELENLSFQALHPDIYSTIRSRVTASEAERLAIISRFLDPVKKILDSKGIAYEVKARVKSPSSIYNKMTKKGIPFEEIFDIFAVRIIFQPPTPEEENDTCHTIFEAFASLYPLHPHRLRDWISNPKENGYRALHLTALGPGKQWVEVQIRSRKMDDIAELGYAAHWKYKEDKISPISDSHELDLRVNTIKDILANPNPDNLDFLDSIKLSLFNKEIYVLTPKGNLHVLPAGSTVLDFARHLSPDLASHCVAGKVNHRLLPPTHPLESGDRVEIIAIKKSTT